MPLSRQFYVWLRYLEYRKTGGKIRWSYREKKFVYLVLEKWNQSCRSVGEKGACPVIYDGNDKLDSKEILAKLENPDRTQVVLGAFPEEILDELDLTVMSPGVPTDLPIVHKMREKNIPVWG